jgi:predicted choloylglycine hydrolase
MKKAIKIILLSLLGLLLVSIILFCALFGRMAVAAASVQKLDEGLYYMEYRGDDGFDELVARGGARNAEELSAYIMQFLSKGFYHAPATTPAAADYGCSALTARTPEGGVLMGRNFDFDDATGVILHTLPKRGYETITTFNTDFFGFGENWKPEGFANQFMALSSLFCALDGINEKGLAIADLMAGDNEETHQDTGKMALTTTTAISYLLKNAATVDEAIELLRHIDMHSDIGAAHHYAMADASGRSVVVEYVNQEMVVVESPAVANHYLCAEKFNAGLVPGDHRYDQLCAQLAAEGGVMDWQKLEQAIFSVSQPQQEDFLGTAWTVVMDLTRPSVTYFSRRHFDQPFFFQLKRRD